MDSFVFWWEGFLSFVFMCVVWFEFSGCYLGGGLGVWDLGSGVVLCVCGKRILSWWSGLEGLGRIEIRE